MHVLWREFRVRGDHVPGAKVRIRGGAKVSGINPGPISEAGGATAEADDSRKGKGGFRTVMSVELVSFE